MSPKLFRTTEYSKFDSHANNRETHEDPRLEESMKRYGFIAGCAIYCAPANAGRFQVIKGHHRLAVARKLKIPVWVILDKKAADVWELEGNSKERWNLKDFAWSRKQAGQAEFDKLVDFAQSNQLGIGMAATLLQGQNPNGQNINTKIKEGTFRVTDDSFAKIVTRMIEASEVGGVSYPRTARYVGALAAIARAKSFDLDRFLSKVTKYGSRIRRMGTREGYIRELESVYNLHSHEHVPLAFEAADALKSRGGNRPAEVVS